MDIKLKNIKYSIVTKGIAVFLVWLCIMSIVFGAGFWLYNQEIVSTKSYYETYGFVSEYSRLVHNVVEYNIKYKNENGVIIFGDTPSSISENAGRYQTIKHRLADTVNFAYYIKNLSTGELITNLNAADRISLLKSQPTYIHITEAEPDYNGAVYYNNIPYIDDIKKMLSGNDYEVRAAIIEPIKPGDIFYNEYTHYSKVKTLAPYVFGWAYVSIILLFAALAYLIYTAGRREKGGEISLTRVDKIYTDIHTLLVLLAAILSLGMVNELTNDSRITGLIIGGSILLSINVFIGLSYVLSMVRQIKSKEIFRNTYIYKLYYMLKSLAVIAFDGKFFKPWTLLILLGYGLVNGILMHLFLETLKIGFHTDFIYGFILVAFNVTAAYFAAKSLVNLAEIIEAVKEVSAGNLDYELKKEDISVVFLGLADNLQSMQKGMKNAVAEAVKGERMKTELITNVSHDLKTPLTSIINYVDLLKNEKLDNENAKEYIVVLEEKSARLKQLVEDLIEASKASSGSLSISTEKINLHQLLMQAYGEYEEKLEQKGLDMRINTVKDDIQVSADGRHLWRVVENLLSNVLKYSMPKSRVYVNIDSSEQFGLLTIKNISAFPLEISPEQLTERFVRGDASRSTEGSGLGLSIAQGLTQLQGGRFKVEIDGDLFKVTIEIPLWKEI